MIPGENVENREYSKRGEQRFERKDNGFFHGWHSAFYGRVRNYGKQRYRK